MATTEKRSKASDTQILSSIWHGLSEHLIARFYPLKKLADGSGWQQSTEKRELATGYTIDDGFEVHAPITEGTSEMTLNWHSPFENAGTESMATTLTSMLQSGTLTPMLQAVAEKLGIDASAATSALEKATGRTGITKLNSTQIFNGMPPLKLSLTAHFRALVDPIAEVRDPISQLQKWAAPQLLSDVGVATNAVRTGGSNGTIESIFPSISPQVIGMRYGDRTYEPMVIESISEPFTNPRTDKGVLVHQSVQITLGTLAALDRRDIDKIYRL